MAELDKVLAELGAATGLQMTELINEIVRQFQESKGYAWRIRQKETSYSLGDKVIVPGKRNLDKVLDCTTSGISSSSDIDYSDLSIGDTITDGTLIWTVISFFGEDQKQSDWNQANNTEKDFIKNKPNLSAVATSGDFDDLENKPTQQQANWKQTDNTKADFIKNKPEDIPSQNNNSGKYLKTNGTNLSWEEIDALPSQTGHTGKVLKTDGEDAHWEEMNALPGQNGHNGKFLKTNGSEASWEEIDELPDQTGNADKILTTNGISASWTGLTSSIPVPDTSTMENITQFPFTAPYDCFCYISTECWSQTTIYINGESIVTHYGPHVDLSKSVDAQLILAEGDVVSIQNPHSTPIGKYCRPKNGTLTPVPEWGKILGAIVDQTDLKEALENKQNKLNPVDGVIIEGDNIGLDNETISEITTLQNAFSNQATNDINLSHTFNFINSLSKLVISDEAIQLIGGSSSTVGKSYLNIYGDTIESSLAVSKTGETTAKIGAKLNDSGKPCVFSTTPIYTVAPVEDNDCATKAYVDSKVTAIYKYKGTVETFYDLPQNKNIGDVYNVVEDYGTTPGGSNYSWTGEAWDPLGGNVDLTAYYTKTESNNLLNEKADKATTLSGYGITNAYNKEEVDDLISTESTRAAGVENEISTALNTLNSQVVNKNENQTINGIKIFSLSPIVPNPSENGHPVTLYYFNTNITSLAQSINTLSLSSVMKTGNQTIAGVKTFSSSPKVPMPMNNSEVANKLYVDGVTTEITDTAVSLDVTTISDYTKCTNPIESLTLTGYQDITRMKTIKFIPSTELISFTFDQNYKVKMPSVFYTTRTYLLIIQYGVISIGEYKND